MDYNYNWYPLVYCLVLIAVITVIFTVAMDTTQADSRDYDPTFGVGDGISFVGSVLFDRGNYDNQSPCHIT